MSTILVLIGTSFAFVYYKLFVVPRHLSHLPRVPILPLIKSYISREHDDERIRRLILPFANTDGHPLVLVWTFGIWMIHILDYQVSLVRGRNDSKLTSASQLDWSSSIEGSSLGEAHAAQRPPDLETCGDFERRVHR